MPVPASSIGSPFQIKFSAPAFGEEDYKICVKNKIIKPDDPPCPLDSNGNFTAVVSDYQGIYIKEADKKIK
jgi:isoleucyl-tRNA synthetase